MLNHLWAWPPSCSTVIGLGIIAGVLVFAGTGVPELALLAAGAVKILLPERGESRSRLEILEETTGEVL